MATSQFGSQENPNRNETDHRSQLTYWDYGYCLTCHKAQGSEWDHVVVFEQIWHEKWSQERWRYTAATRAAKKLTYAYESPV